MTVATYTQAKFERHVNPAYPKGVQAWWATGTVTGSGLGGTCNVVVELESLEVYRRWWLLDTVSVVFSGDPATTCWVYYGAGDWERTAADTTVAQLGATGVLTPTAVPFLGTYHCKSVEPVYFGRAATSSPTLIVMTPDTHTKTMQVLLTGMVSENPAFALDNWRA